MRNVKYIVYLLLLIGTMCLAAVSRKMATGDWSEVIEAVKPLHSAMGKPQAGDWLLSHKEAGQTFRQYVASRPVRPTSARKTLYMISLGDFSETSASILKQTAAFMSIFYGLEVKTLESVSLDTIPAQSGFCGQNR